MAARIKAVLLDVDGTLVDSNDLHARAWVEAAAEFGVELPFERVRPLIGRGADTLIPEATRLSADEPLARKMAQRQGEIFLERHLRHVRPFPRVRELVTRLQAAGYTLVVASSSGPRKLDALLAQAGLDDLLPRRAPPSEVEDSKPAADLVQAALGEAGVRPDQALMLADTPWDLEAGRRAGVGVVAFRCGGWDSAALEGAVAIYEDPADLLAAFDASPLGPERPAAQPDGAPPPA